MSVKEADFLNTYQGQVLPSQLKALKRCRTKFSPVMQVSCIDCKHQAFVPHSCGHRNCPHCQHHESQLLIENQLKKQLPGSYFMMTFTLPAQIRSLAWDHQKLVYRLMFECVWQTLQTFSRNDKKLRGDPGIIAVLHTHSRKLDYDHQGGWKCKRETGDEAVHPHIHTVMPATVVDRLNKLTRTKQGKYLFNHKALTKVFRGKLLSKLAKANLILPKSIPQKWVVNCKQVGTENKVLIPTS